MNEDCFIRYPIVARVLAHMTEIIFDPPRFRPEGVLLLSDPNNGKSCTLRKLASEAHTKIQSVGQGSHFPIITVQAPVAGVRRDFYSALAKALCIPEPSRMPALRIRQRTIEALAEAKTLALCVDEIHHIMPGGWARQRVLLDDLKYISNELKLPIFLAGTAHAYALVSRDEQYLDRFRPIQMPRWNLDRDFVMLLRTLEQNLKTPEGSFTCKAHAELIWKHSRGLLGRVVDICEKAQHKSRYSPTGKITETELNAAGFGDLPWVRGYEMEAK